MSGSSGRRLEHGAQCGRLPVLSVAAEAGVEHNRLARLFSAADPRRRRRRAAGKIGETATMAAAAGAVRAEAARVR